MQLTRRTIWERATALVLVAQLCLGSGCDLIPQAQEAVRASLVKAGDELNQSVDALEQTIERQRTALTGDMNTLVGALGANMAALAEQARTSVDAVLSTAQGLEESLTAGLVHSLKDLRSTADGLTRAIQTGADATIRQAALEFERQRTTAIQQLQTATDAVLRPALAQLTRVGDRLVGQAQNLVASVILRIVGGLILLAAVIGLVVGLVKKSRAAAIAMGLVSLAGVALVLFAVPLSRVGQKEISLPAPEVLCDQMQTLADRLRPFETPRPHATAVREGAARSTAARSAPTAMHSLRLRTAAAETPAPEPQGREQVAVALLGAATQCLTWAPTGPMAELAKQAFTRALAQLSNTVFCHSPSDCTVLSMACDQYTSVCLEWGLYCEAHSDCVSPLGACDLNKRRCVKPDRPCTTPNDCPAGYACDARRPMCVSIDEVNRAREACEVTTAPPNSPCRPGVVNVTPTRWVECAPTGSASAEVCDAVDNNCNGSVDEGYARSGPCNEGVGACRDGAWACVGGQEKCNQAAPQPEVCDNRDNDCNGVVDDAPLNGDCQVPGARGVCASGKKRCAQCVPVNAPGPEACDNLDNNCNGITDDFGACGIVEFMVQGPDDRNKELTRRPGLPTDTINTTGIAGPSRCPEDEHGRVFIKQSASASAESSNGATCSVIDWVNTDPKDCRVNVQFRTVRMGSNVWCTVRWVGGVAGPWRH